MGYSLIAMLWQTNELLWQIRFLKYGFCFGYIQTGKDKDCGLHIRLAD